jgi:hypothetical protein
MTTPSQSVSVTRPVGQAIERVKRLLFEPFDLGTVLRLPVLVFFRAYPAHYLAQYGSEWDVFTPEIRTDFT